MALTDLPLDALREYRGDVAEPDDFDAFWAGSLALARTRPLDLVLSPAPGPALPALTVQDVRFTGWGGVRVAAWLVRPAHLPGPLPVVVEFIGYGGGRGLPVERTTLAAAGYAHLVVDTRGMGHATPDPDPDTTGGQWARGFMTKGITDPATSFYRRALVDCVRAVEAAHALPGAGVDVDTRRVVVRGTSQGGAFALAAAGACGSAVAAALVDVPFLCHVRRGVDLATEGPFLEVRDYLRTHSRTAVESAFATMAYVDGANHGGRATAPALFGVGLMDPVCPPSTVFAAFNRYGEIAASGSGNPLPCKEIDVWEFGDHGGGGADQVVRQLEFLADLWR